MKTHYFTVDDIGSTLAMTVRDPDGSPLDVSGRTVVIRLAKPDATSTTITMGYVTDGTDGRVDVTWNGQLDVAGMWKGEVMLDSEQIAYEIVQIRVRQKLVTA